LLASTRTARNREIACREEDPYDGRCSGLQNCRCSSRKPVKCKLGPVTRFAHYARENKTEGRIEAQRRQEHRRLARIESRRTKNLSQVGRARRSGLGVVKRWVPQSCRYKVARPQPMRMIGSKHDHRDAISLGTIEHGCTSFRVLWMAVAFGAHLACAKGREARADASSSRNSVVVDATLEDWKAKRCDADMTVSQTGERHVCDRRVERFAEFQRATGVSDSFSLSDLHRSGGRRI
jgi:hypothetical protein